MDSYQAPAPDALRVFETLPDLYLVLSPNLVILTASKAYVEASMIERENMIGQPLFEVFPDRTDEDEIPVVKASLQQVLATHQPHQMDVIRYDLAHPTQPGQRVERYWSTLHTPVMDETGAVLYIIHRTKDITEQVKTNTSLEVLQEQQRQHQEQIERQRDLLQTLLNQAPVAMCLFQGNDLVVTSANQLICDIWGYPPEQVLDRPLLEGVPELKGQGFDDLLREVLETGISHRGTETPAKMLRDGQLKTTYYNFVYQPLYNEQKEIIGVVDVAIDVTEQVEARQKIEQSQRKVQALNEELRTTNEELTRAKTTLEQLNSE